MSSTMFLCFMQDDLLENSAPGLQFQIEGGLITSKNILHQPQLSVAI